MSIGFLSVHQCTVRYLRIFNVPVCDKLNLRRCLRTPVPDSILTETSKYFILFVSLFNCLNKDVLQGHVFLENPFFAHGIKTYVTDRLGRTPQH